MSVPITLPSRESIAFAIDRGTDEDYHLIRLYYTWYSGWFYRYRLQMVADLIGEVHLSNILEIGTGSGIFIKELLRHADRVAAIDIHATYHGVRAMLECEAINQNRVELRQGSIFDIPYEADEFDAVVCVSVLEHFADPIPALREMSRVVKPNGVLLLGFPARNRLTNFLFQALGYNAYDIHPASHTTLLKSIKDTLAIDTVRQFPFNGLAVYYACRVRRKSSGSA